MESQDESCRMILAQAECVRAEHAPGTADGACRALFEQMWAWLTVRFERGEWTLEQFRQAMGFPGVRLAFAVLEAAWALRDVEGMRQACRAYCTAVLAARPQGDQS